MFRLMILCALLLLLAPLVTCAEAPWNQFRGPRGDGVAQHADPPVEFGPEKNLLWRTPIHGRAWSSPVVLGSRVWLTTATEDGKKLSALCVDLESGEVLWDRVVFEVEEPRFCHPTNTYASCTPWIEAGRLIVHFGSYGTACLDPSSGESLWERRDFVSDDFRGPASSPVVDGDLVYVNFDGVDFQFFVALDKATGETVLRRDRDIEYGVDNGDWKKAYGTPRVITFGGERQLISPAAKETVAYSLPDAEPLWRVRHGGMNAAAPPLFDGERVIVTGGSGPMKMAAVRPDGRGDVTDSHVAWREGRSVPDRAAPLLWDGMIFTVDDKGVAVCRDAATGSVHWTERLGGEFWSSPVAAAGRVYALNKSGYGYVFATEKEFRQLAQTSFGEEVNATPAIVGDTLLVRTAAALYRFGAKKE